MFTGVDRMASIYGSMSVMRQQSTITNKPDKSASLNNGNPAVMVVGFCVMLIFVTLISFQGNTIGRDYLTRSAAITSLKTEQKKLLKENRDLRKEKAFVKTDQGKEITARRRYLYKRPQETYSIIDFETKK